MSDVGGEILHRRIYRTPQQLVIDQETRRVTGPTSAAFEPDDDGLSVYLESRLTILGLGPKDTRINSSQVVAALDEPVLRLHSLELKPDPELIEDPQPAGQAHALVQGWPSSRKGAKKVARELARASRCSFPEGAWESVSLLSQG